MSVPVQFTNPNRRVIRAPVNEMDKSTIVSIFPKEIIEIKPTIQPGKFHIMSGSYENPSVLVVGSSSWWREIDEDQPLLEIPTSSVAIADSVIRDYCNGLLGFNSEDAMPGMFFIPGSFDPVKIKKDYKGELDKALKKQRNWYSALIKLADALWSRSNGNPLAISEDFRMAAREMGQTTRDWMKDFNMLEMTRCKACGALKNPAYPVCSSCKYIDHDHPDAGKLKFAM